MSASVTWTAQNPSVADWTVTLGASASVSSVFGRAGTVTAQSGDYTAEQVGADPVGSADIAQAAAEGFATSAIAALSGEYQPLDADLTAIAALSTTTFGRSILTQATAAATRTTLGLGTAATTDATAYDASGAAAASQAASQPLDSDLTAIAALVTTSFGRNLLTLADAPAARTALGLGTAATTSASAYDAAGAAAAAQAASQPLNTDLTTISGLTPSNGNLLLRTSGLWVAGTAAAVKTALAITESDVANLTTDLAAKVPTARQLAGLDLTADRSASALKTALAITESDVSGLTSDLALKAPLASPTFTGTVVLPAGTVTQAMQANIADQRIVGNISGGAAAPAQLTAAQVLTMLNIPQWQVLFAGSLAGLATKTISFSGLSRVRGYIFGASTRAATADSQLVRLNGDSSSSYSNQTGALATSWNIGNLPATTTNTDRTASMTFEIMCGSASQWTVALAIMFGEGTSTGVVSSGAVTASLTYQVDAAITSFTILSNTASNWQTGTRLFLEGIV